MKSLVLSLVLAVALGVPARADDLQALPYAAAGPSASGSASLVLHDTSRGKDLEIDVTFPETGTAFPVIVFSHGAYGSKDRHKILAAHWASHGFVVIQPTHEDSAKFGSRVGETPVGQYARSRPLDVSFILDSLVAIEAGVPPVRGRLDGARIGVGGHSFGAHTSQLIAGMTLFEDGKPQSYRDPRVRAAVLLSATGLSRDTDAPDGPITEDSFKGLALPLLVMTGTLDASPRVKVSVEAFKGAAFALSPPGDKIFVMINGGRHNFGGLSGVEGEPGSERNMPGHIAIVKAASLAFFRAHLMDDARARRWLGEEFAAAVGGAALVKMR